MLELLNAIKSALLTIPSIKTARIGVEVGISAKDCPAARIVCDYSEVIKQKYFEEGEIQVILLFDLKNDLEAVYQESIEMELLVREKLKTIVDFKRTDYDQDSVAKFKASILRFGFRIANQTGVSKCN